MKIFVDCDILLDVGLGREPFCHASGQLLDYLESNPGKGFLALHSLANFFYITSKAEGQEKAKAFIVDLCDFMNISSISNQDVLAAVALPVNDFEDALQCVSALSCNASVIVTRNISDYKNSPIRAVTPEQILNEIIHKA